MWVLWCFDGAKVGCLYDAVCQSWNCVVKSSWFLAHLRAILAKKTQGEKSSGMDRVNHGIFLGGTNVLARDTRAHSLEFCIFCFHNLHTQSDFLQRLWENVRLFFFFLPRFLNYLRRSFSKLPQRWRCEGCESKKSEFPVMRARVTRAWENVRF